MRPLWPAHVGGLADRANVVVVVVAPGRAASVSRACAPVVPWGFCGMHRPGVLRRRALRRKSLCFRRLDKCVARRVTCWDVGPRHRLRSASRKGLYAGIGNRHARRVRDTRFGDGIARRSAFLFNSRQSGVLQISNRTRDERVQRGSIRRVAPNLRLKQVLQFRYRGLGSAPLASFRRGELRKGWGEACVSALEDGL